MDKSAAKAMTYTYTVRPMGEKKFPLYGNECSYEITGVGAVVTIREQHTNKVVQQFPRVNSEEEGHHLAQFHIKLLKGL